MSKTFDVGIRITADGRVLVTEARSAKEALNQLGETTRKTSGESANLANQVSKQSAALNQSASQASAHTASLSGMKSGLVAAAAAYVSFSSAMAGGKAIIDAALANERLNNTLKVATGSTQAATQEIAFLRQESEKLGLQFATTADQYAKLAAASKDTALQGQATRDIFLAVSKASTVLGLSAAETGGALNAIQQMISKGTVSAEELRGQLGERLPGAFQMAARSIGVTTQELGKMLEQGQLTADRLLPALAAELEKTFGAQAQQAAQGLNAKINRLDNSFTDLKTSIGQTGLIDLFSGGINAATKLVNFINNSVIPAVKSIGQVPVLGTAAKALFGGGVLGKLAEKPEIAVTNTQALIDDKTVSGIAKPGTKPSLPDSYVKAAREEVIARQKLTQEREREAQRAVESSQRIIGAFKRETQEIGLNTVQKKMLAAAAEAAQAPTKELAQEIMNSAAAWAQATQQQEAMVAAEKARANALLEIERAAQERARAEQQAAQEVRQNWRNTWSQVEQNAKMAFIQFAAHGKSAAQAVGEAIKFSVIDVLYQMTIRKWIINIGASIESTFAGSLAGSAAGAGMNALNIASLGTGAMNIMKSGFGLIPSTLGRFGSALPGSAGAFFSGMGGTGAAAAQGAQAMWGASGLTGANAMGAAAGSAFASMAGPLLIGYMATKGLKALAGDKRLGGGFGDAMNFVGDIPVIGDLIPIIPIINGLFGRGPYKFRQQVALGTASEEGFDGRVTDIFRSKGGLFMGNKHKELSAGNESELLNLFDETIQGFATSAKQFADNLGISKEFITGYSKEIRLESEKGKTLTEEAIQSMLAGIGDEIARGLVPAIDSLSKSGETAFQTLTRLNNEFSTLVNVGMLLGSSVANAKEFIKGFSFDDRTAFIDKAGGIDALAQKAQFFSDNFLNEAERLAPAQEQLNEQLAQLGLSSDLTKEQFKGLVQSFGGVNGISADLLQSLLTLAPAFIEVRTAQEQLAEATRQKAEADRESAKIAQEAARALLINNAGSAFSALQKSVDQERKKITDDYNTQLDKVNTRIQDISESIGKLKSLSDALKNTINQIQPLSRDQAKQQIQDAIKTARRGGELPDAESLRNALGVLGNNQTIDNALSPFEKAREQAKTAILLGQLGSVTDSRLTLEERSLAALEGQKKRLETGFDDQMKRLDTMLEQGQTQVDLLNGINTSAKDIVTALSQFNFRLLQAGGQPIALPSGEIPVMRGNPKITDQQIRDFAGAPGRTAMEIYNAARDNGVSFAQYANATGANLKTLRLWARRNNLPTFENGGYHSGGLALVGEKRPEVIFSGPSRIVSSTNEFAKMFNNADVVKELRILVTEIKEVKKSSERTASRLDAVTKGGTALRTKAA